MDDYLSEKEQIKLIKNWWRENGAFVIAGLVLGIAILGGWNYWQSYRTSRAEAAGGVYQNLVAAVDRGDRDAATAALETLEADYESTPYSDQGRLMLARLLVETGELEAAAGRLQAIVESTSDRELESIARIRLARVLLADDQSGPALEALDLTRAGAFLARFHEVRGDVLARRGESPAAFEEYQQALDSAAEGVVDRQAIRLKMDSLDVEPEDETSEPTEDA